ncbi:uncharacterized protein [Antedon mediterranea]|uniref:uncharacterized protein n=1 Tax=Antedon mediterranea TaxID=105859 RepID=UPI003AF5F332
MSKVSAIICITLIASMAIQPSEAGVGHWIAGAAAAVTAVAIVPAALGFGALGIASGSIGAGMMSASAIANGGGVLTGGVVATLQSVGVAGASYSTYAAAAAAGGAAVDYFTN